MRPVEVGLLGREQVEVPLAGRAVRVLVRVHAEPPKIDCQPFGGSSPSGPRPGRNQKRSRSGEPGARRERRAEPRVLVRDVVRDDVDDRADPERARLGDQLLGLREGPERRVDRPVVGDVVARVGHRRRVPGVEPEGVDAEVAQVGQPVADARQVADAVAVRVGEAPDVDLVDDGVAPPPVACCRRAAVRAPSAVLPRLPLSRRAFTRRQSHIQQSIARARRNIADS